MSGPRRIVVVGAGLAGAKAVETLRADGFDGTVTLFGSEAERPYERPGLSKDFLRGEADFDAIAVHDADFLGAHDVDFRAQTRVASIDREHSEVVTEAGARVGYDRLLLATGSHPRRLDLPGADLAGIHLLRTVADATALREALAPDVRVAVVGAGWIGSEVAASTRQLGAEVTLVDPLSVPLERVLGSEVGTVYRDLHVEHGVAFSPGTSVEGFVGDDTVRAVRTGAGDVPADVVVVGVGALPRTELAAGAGLTVSGGVEVDEHLRTADPHILAAGDIAAAWHPGLGVRLRVEHWANALNQGVTAGHNLLDADEVYDRTPYFYSDQYDLGMEYRGHATEWDRVVFRGDPAAREFCAFWLSSGRVVAAMNANVWDVGDALEALVRDRATVDPDVLADASADLTGVAA